MRTAFSRFVTAAGLSAVLLLAPAVPALAADTTRPTISLVSPTEATVGDEITFTATYSDDDSGVAWCKLYVEFEDQGEMTLSGGVASTPFTFTGGGVYTVFVHCRDEAGNAANGANTAVVVSTASGSSGDTTPPTVSAVSPTTAQVDVPVTFEADYSDGAGVSSCRLIVNGFDRGAMTLASGTASRDHTFDAAGSAIAYAQCSDTSGNTGSGPSVSVTVSETEETPIVPEPEPEPTVTPGLVKLSCPGDSTAEHPCRAVYYRASDGTRHAFPNERIYFTWYADFSSVDEISATDMASLPLGRNVTYRPGVRMVKFVTDPKVYAVERAGTLRWIASESIAAALYDAQWSTFVDDLSDAFAADYTIGLEITNTSYSPADATAATTSIDDNF